jgi:pyruvate kinase
MSKNFDQEIDSIISQLHPIRLEVLQAEQHFREELDHVHLANLQSARNLTHYMSLRRHDIRELQEDLGRLALSSLGRLESHVTATLDALLALLYRIAGKEWHGRAIEETFAEFDSGSALLEKHTVEALGEAPADRNVRIMVTMPSEAANDPNLVRDFLNRGMNIMRINCAHDSAEEWLRMVENLHAAQKETAKPCKIAFDLAGPKLRTGPVSPSPGIIRWKPERNELGQVMTAAYVTFHTGSYSLEGETIPVPIKGSLFRHVQAGDIVELIDTRGRERTLHVVEVEGPSCLCTNDRTGYVVQGTKLRLQRGKELLCEDEVGTLPEVEDCLSLSAGDDLILTRAEVPGKVADYDDDDEVVYQPAQIGCSLPEVFADARPSERIFFETARLRVSSERSPKKAANPSSK